jgi:hypothetical protein
MALSRNRAVRGGVLQRPKHGEQWDEGNGAIMDNQQTGNQQADMKPRDWRFAAGLCAILAVAIVVALTMFHFDQKTAGLNSASGVVNGKPVADSTASD